MTRESKHYLRSHRPSADAGLTTVALFEGAKGLLVLLTGLGILSLVHHNLHQAAADLVRHLHMNPASHYPRIFIDAIGSATNSQLWYLAVGAFLYTLARFIEAWGLWRERRWAEWFGLLSGGIYIPVELYEVFRAATWPKMLLLSVNSLIVLYLLRVVIRSRHS
jgi:uncharacterized membrane protein (DUF2068 family)